MTVAIAVIAKAPVSNSVKTRLCPPLDPGAAARVAAAMLRDVIDNCAGPNREVMCVYAGEPAVLRACVGKGVPLRPQGPGGLAERLRRAQVTLAGEGFGGVVLMSGDSPTVEPALIDGVISALQRPSVDVVVGPASDGGYTLLASRLPTPSLFADIEMSTSRVLEQTLHQARRSGLTAELMPTRHDIDTVDDYHSALARGELAFAPRTRAAFDAALPAAEGSSRELAVPDPLD